jgi:hypothetical protein
VLFRSEEAKKAGHTAKNISQKAEDEAKKGAHKVSGR